MLFSFLDVPRKLTNSLLYILICIVAQVVLSVDQAPIYHNLAERETHMKTKSLAAVLLMTSPITHITSRRMGVGKCGKWTHEGDRYFPSQEA